MLNVWKATGWAVSTLVSNALMSVHKIASIQQTFLYWLITHLLKTDQKVKLSSKQEYIFFEAKQQLLCPTVPEYYFRHRQSSKNFTYVKQVMRLLYA